MQSLTPLEASKALVSAMKSEEAAEVALSQANTRHTNAKNEGERARSEMMRVMDLPFDTPWATLRRVARAIIETAEQAQATGKRA
mgnify:CR=1 FL=1